MDRDAVARRIRSAMEEAGYTQSALARSLGISHTTVWTYLNKGVVPQGERLVELAELLGVTTDYLLSGRQPPIVTAKPPFWDEFLASYPYAEDLTDEDRAHLRGFWSPTFEIRAWSDWATLADWLRQHKRRG